MRCMEIKLGCTPLFDFFNYKRKGERGDNNDVISIQLDGSAMQFLWLSMNIFSHSASSKMTRKIPEYTYPFITSVRSSFRNH